MNENQIFEKLKQFSHLYKKKRNSLNTQRKNDEINEKVLL